MLDFYRRARWDRILPIAGCALVWAIIFAVGGCVSIPNVSYFVVEQRECKGTRSMPIQEPSFPSHSEVRYCYRWGPRSKYYQKFPYREVNPSHLTFYPSGTIVISQQYRHLYGPDDE